MFLHSPFDWQFRVFTFFSFYNFVLRSNHTEHTSCRSSTTFCWLCFKMYETASINHQSDSNYFSLYTGAWSYWWRNGYCPRKWTLQQEFKFWSKLFAFQIALILSVGIKLFPLYGQIIGQTRLFNFGMATSKRERKLNSNLLNFA